MSATCDSRLPMPMAPAVNRDSWLIRASRPEAPASRLGRASSSIALCGGQVSPAKSPAKERSKAKEKAENERKNQMGLSSYPGPPDGLLAMLVMSIVYVVAMLLNVAASLAPEDGGDSRPPAGERSRASTVRVRRFESRRRRGGSSRAGASAVAEAAAEECCVCLSGFEDEEEVSEVESCKHVFHKGCLERWFQDYRPNTCPLCRSLC